MFFFVCSATFCSVSSSVGDPQPQHIDAVGGRALESCLQILESSLDCVITYEDPPYSAAGGFKEMFKGGPIIPITSHVEFDYFPDEGARLTIRRLVKKFNEENDAELFRVVEYNPTPTIYNVFPANERSATGRVTPVQSILSPEVSLEFVTTNASQDILEVLCREVSRNTTHRLDYLGFGGLTPHRPMDRDAFSLAVTNCAAQLCLDDILSQLNATNSIKVSCSIREDPYSHSACLLLHKVRRTEASQSAIVVEEARPISIALRILEQRLGCTISYEDPLLLCPCDVMRNREGEPQLPSGDIVKCLYNAGDDPLHTIDSLLKNSRLGVFSVATSAQGVYSVFPLRSKDANGELQETQALSTRRVTTPHFKQSARQMLDQICRDLSAQGSVVVRLGQIPPDISGQVVNTPVAMNEPLHVALTACVKAVGKDLTWQLLYDPRGKSYTLNIYRMSDFSSLY